MNSRGVLGPGREHCPTQMGSTPRAPVVGASYLTPGGGHCASLLGPLIRPEACVNLSRQGYCLSELQEVLSGPNLLLST